MNPLEQKEIDARVWTKSEVENHIDRLKEQGIYNWGRVTLSMNQVKYLRRQGMTVIETTTKGDQHNKHLIEF